jgi:hypothetical protein
MSKKSSKITPPQETYSFASLEAGDLIEVDTSLIESSWGGTTSQDKSCYLVLETSWIKMPGGKSPIFAVSLFKLDSQKKLAPLADFTSYFSIKLISKGTDVSDKNTLSTS